MVLLRKIYLLAIVIMFMFVQNLFAQQVGTFYWIGGTGNWSDTLNWFSESGGLPTENDHVVFDGNSFSEKFQVVIIDTEAHCSDMDWTATDMEPMINGNKKLNIHGSLKLTPGMTINYTGAIHFLSDAGDNALLLNGNTLNSDLYFNGDGSWQLLDTLDVGLKKIVFNRGILHLSNQVIKCGSFSSATAFPRTLVMNGSAMTIQLPDGVWNVNSQLNLQMQGNGSIMFVEGNASALNTFNGGGLNYGHVLFGNNAVINGNNGFGNVYMNAAREYILAEGNTQTINGQLFARGCAGMISISSSGTDQAMIKKINGDINLSFVSLQSIQAQVAAPFQFFAHNSMDEGNNSGIQFSVQSRDLYWINGSGNWTDTTHWSSVPVNEDSDCAPMAFDNVFFNSDSFPGLSDTISVNMNKINVHDMTWSGEKSPVFINSVAPVRLDIYGSLQLSSKMKNYLGGSIHFLDTLGGKSVATAHRKFLNDLVFSGNNNGGWVIYDSLSTDGSIYYIQGSLYTQGNYVSCYSFHSDSALPRNLTLDTSVVRVTGGIAGTSWSINSELLQFDPGNSLIEISAFDGSLSSFGGDTILYNDIAFLRNTGTGRINTASDSYGIFRKAEWMSNGSIAGSNMFDTLSFSPGCFYDIPPGSTQTIMGHIHPSGTCTGPVLLKSTINGKQAGLNKSTDTLLVENIALRDINALGGAVFIAENSVDLGNNNGWDTIAITAPGKLFWVGGSGNWSDISHWSATSGGEGGLCTPTPYDTVIFDQNSFYSAEQYVSIDLNNAFAGYMDWSEAEFKPDFKGNISTSWLRIYGSLFLNPNMEFTFPGYISFESSHPGEIIMTEGIKFHNINNNVCFDGIGGEWTLIDSLQLGHSMVNKNNLFFYNGTIHSNDQYIDCYGFYSNRPNNRVFNPGSSHIDVYYEWNMHGENLSIADNSSLITLAKGNFIHRHGTHAPYHDLIFNSTTSNQYMMKEDVGEVKFRNVLFESPTGRIYGKNSLVKGENVIFKGAGFVNTSNASNVNVYVMDSLIFHAGGNVFGKDTVHQFLLFNDIGNITGNGYYANAMFLNDGVVRGNNVFDILTFNPPYTYELGSENVQTITDQFNITGNNCERIVMKATSATLAEIFKESGKVQGDFIEMSRIRATGEAEFDAGQFSIDVDNSNEGWIFYDPSLNYRLVSDSSFQQGDTVFLCAEHFNGNSMTTYDWFNCETGEFLGSDSCLAITEKGTYCLTVFYDEGEGCEQSDSIVVGCHLGLGILESHITCHGFEDGFIQMIVEAGEEPFDIQWYNNGLFISDSLVIENLTAGTYSYQIEDSEGCYSAGNIVLTQPDQMIVGYTSLDACFGIENGIISLEVSGGTAPYLYSWSHGASTDEIFGLTPGLYEVSVTDINYCPDVQESVVIEEIPELKFALSGNDLVCYDDSSGVIQIIELVGGTGNYVNYYWFKDGGFYSETPGISGLQAGHYELVITDDRGCTGANHLSINQPDPILIELESLKEAIELGSIDLTVTGGVPPYTYLWNTGATTEDIDPLGGGTYTVEVTDGHLCKATGSIFVEVHYRVYAPTAFSPNGDGVNDTFFLFGLGTDLKEFNLTIFNRFGQTVFQSKNVNEGWNGRLMNAGKIMPAEVYTWQAEIVYIGGETLIESGNVTLLR
jgi:gliding motility-associated-like protein